MINQRATGAIAVKPAFEFAHRLAERSGPLPRKRDHGPQCEGAFALSHSPLRTSRRNETSATAAVPPSFPVKWSRFAAQSFVVFLTIPAGHRSSLPPPVQARALLACYLFRFVSWPLYDQDVIDHHRAFIARRRSVRPSGEYREPTDSEWDEFLGHFAARKIELGTCGRAYGSGCQHEHACIRCPMLRPDPGQQIRLEEIIANLHERLGEAHEHGWLGEVNGLKTSLAAAQQKHAQTRRTATNLGLPALPPRSAQST